MRNDIYDIFVAIIKTNRLQNCHVILFRERANQRNIRLLRTKILAYTILRIDICSPVQQKINDTRIVTQASPVKSSAFPLINKNNVSYKLNFPNSNIIAYIIFCLYICSSVQKKICDNSTAI